MSMNNTLNCVILHQKCRFLTKEKRRKSLICSVLSFLNLGSSGATGIRTRDTRIFSPLLYQLSYGTIVYVCLIFLSECKDIYFFCLCKLFCKIFFIFYKTQPAEHILNGLFTANKVQNKKNIIQFSFFCNLYCCFAR